MNNNIPFPPKIIYSFLKCCLILLFILPFQNTYGQNGQFWVPSDTLNKKRLWSLAGGGTLAYSGATVGLYHLWYKNYDLEPIHSNDDWGEW